MAAQTLNSNPVQALFTHRRRALDRCPLHCLYCLTRWSSNAPKQELSPKTGSGSFTRLSRLGILHVHLTGGEPLARKDLPELIAAARTAGLYVNMITSGVGLSEDRLASLVDAGLEHLQLSFQDIDEASANHIAGARSMPSKLHCVPVLSDFRSRLRSTWSVHRMNLSTGWSASSPWPKTCARSLEIAHVQYYGWALKNRAPDADSGAGRPLHSDRRSRQERLKGKIHLEAVFPDYYASFPKACVGGWGRQMMLIDPIGQAMPCHAAAVIPDLRFRQRARTWSGLDLAVLTGFQSLSRRCMDVRNLPGLPRARRKTSADAAARPSCSPATPKPSIPSAATARITVC